MVARLEDRAGVHVQVGGRVATGGTPPPLAEILLSVAITQTGQMGFHLDQHRQVVVQG